MSEQAKACTTKTNRLPRGGLGNFAAKFVDGLALIVADPDLGHELNVKDVFQIFVLFEFSAEIKLMYIILLRACFVWNICIAL